MKKHDILRMMAGGALSVLIALGGCGNAAEEADEEIKERVREPGEDEGDTDPEPDDGQNAGEGDVDEETFETDTGITDVVPGGPFAGAFENGEVENNGGYFVRVGKKVYYTLYDKDGLEKAAIGPNIIVPAEGAETSALRYFEPDGYSDGTVVTGIPAGKFFATVNGFVVKNKSGYGSMLIDPSGEITENYLDGIPLAVSGDGRSIAMIDYPEAGGVVSYIVYHDEEEVCRLDEDDHGYMLACDFAGNSFLALYCSYEEDGGYTLKAFADDGSVRELGRLEYEFEPYGWPEFKKLNYDGKTADILLAWYDGSGHFLQWWGLYNADPEVEDSVKLVKEPAGNSEGEPPEPKLSVDEYGNADVKEHAGGELDLSDFDHGDLIMYDGNGNKETLLEDFIAEGGNNDGDLNTFMQEAVLLNDGELFILTGRGRRDPAEDIGWRPAYDVLGFEYYAIPLDAARNDLDLDNGGVIDEVSFE